MPAWKDKLSDNDIEAVIAWIQARWPEDVYKSWVLMDERRQGCAVNGPKRRKARRGLVRH